MSSDLVEITIPTDSTMINKAIVELHLPEDLLVILIKRDHEFVVPNGGTILRQKDKLLVLSDEKSLNAIKDRFQIDWEQNEP